MRFAKAIFMLTALVFLALIILSAIPLKFKGHGLCSLDDMFVLLNLAVGVLPEFALKVRLADGVVLEWGGKSRKVVKKPVDKNGKSFLERSLPRAVLSGLKIKRLELRGVAGVSDAKTTALFCEGSVMILDLIKNTLSRKTEVNAQIEPFYDGDKLELEIKVIWKFNFALILFTLAKILFIGENRNEL